MASPLFKLALQLADVFHALRNDRADMVVGERIKHALPLAPAFDELAALEDAQLVGHGRLRHAQRLGQIADADLRLDEVKSELLPADKVGAVEELLAAQPEKEKLAFVGDGINDAPVLARADIGIAMGALGSDAAIEAADVVLMDDEPGKIAKAIRISRKCLRIVKENIWFAIAVKLLCLALGALGLAGMWAAIFADVGVMVIAVLNALRALHVKNL